MKTVRPENEMKTKSIKFTIRHIHNNTLDDEEYYVIDAKFGEESLGYLHSDGKIKPLPQKYQSRYGAAFNMAEHSTVMKIQRILQATVRKEYKGKQSQIILAITKGYTMQFATWRYIESTRYSKGHHFLNFHLAHEDFIKRCSKNGGARSIEYCGK